MAFGAAAGGGPVAMNSEPSPGVRHMRNRKTARATRHVHDRRLHQLLAQARSRLKQRGPSAAWKAKEKGAVLVDIRPEFQRHADGEIHGAIGIERNTLECR